MRRECHQEPVVRLRSSGRRVRPEDARVINARERYVLYVVLYVLYSVCFGRAGTFTEDVASGSSWAGAARRLKYIGRNVCRGCNLRHFLGMGRQAPTQFWAGTIAEDATSGSSWACAARRLNQQRPAPEQRHQEINSAAVPGQNAADA